MTEHKYRRPNGRETASAAFYIREWRALARKVLRFLPGYYVIGYDPGILIGNRQGKVIDLSMDLIHALLSNSSK